VVGFETDFSGWDMSASSGVSASPPIVFSSTASINSNWLFTARPRLGIANGNMLTYLTGGLAVGNFNFSESVLLAGSGPALAGSVSTTDVGWIAGAGVEYALSWNWSIEAEYLYVNFSNQTASQVVSGFLTLTGTATANLNASIVRGGLNYRF